MFQALTFEEEAAIPTCNLSETVHNKWLQASGNKMIDVYHATVDDFAQAALQSLFYFNYLRGGSSGTRPSKFELELRLASRNGNSKCVMKLLDEVAVEADLNTRVPHLEGETIFGTAKRKLNLPPGDDSDSHRHDQMNFAVPKVDEGVSFFQAQRVVRPNSKVGESVSVVRSSSPLLQSKVLTRSMTGTRRTPNGVPVTSSENPVFESPCSNTAQFRIERIASESSEMCCGRYGGKRCNIRIAKYRRAVAAPTFLGIEMQSKSSDTRQVQVWFCPTRLDRCVLGPEAKWIINYPDVPDKWPVKLGTNLCQSEISALESGGFVLDDRIPLNSSTPATVFDVPDSKDAVDSTSASSEDLGNVAFVSLDPLKFNLGHPRSSMMSLRNQLEASLDGDKRPTIWDGRPIRFVSRSSPDHLKKMESSRSISCSIMKFVKVPSPGYGIVLTLCTPGSMERKELYEVSISNYLSCSCPDFNFMKARANRKQKWMPC